jgi:transposase
MADMLVHEVLSRPMRDRKAVARYAGLTGSPDESGAKRREQGLARAGNARVRRGMIQLAWMMSGLAVDNFLCRNDPLPRPWQGDANEPNHMAACRF